MRGVSTRENMGMYLGIVVGDCRHALGSSLLDDSQCLRSDVDTNISQIFFTLYKLSPGRRIGAEDP